MFYSLVVIYHQLPAATMNSQRQVGRIQLQNCIAQCIWRHHLAKRLRQPIPNQKQDPLLDLTTSGIPGMSGLNEDGTPSPDQEGGDSGGDGTSRHLTQLNIAVLLAMRFGFTAVKEKLFRLLSALRDDNFIFRKLGCRRKWWQQHPNPQWSIKPHQQAPVSERQAKSN